MHDIKQLYTAVRDGIRQKAKAHKHARKAKRRAARFADESLWQEAGENGLARRRYASYDDYLTHQAAKLEHIAHRLTETEQADLAEFKRRFASCAALGATQAVLCLGARLGSEVRALLELGHLAIGVDLNPGEKNPYVLYGDFHRLVFPDQSFDAVYTNALDHVFDLAQVRGEVLRVLRPGGAFVVDMVEGYEEGFLPGAYESTHWPSCQALVEALCETGALRSEGLRDLGRFRRDRWTQAILRNAG